MQITASKQPTYMIQLDALRFFAVLAVMVTHNWHPRRLPWLLADLDFAGLGVRMFFVLSGFLITGILIGCRNEVQKSAASPLFFVRQFYARRFLRIFPVYYLVVFIVVLLNLEQTREIWPWLVTYTSNIYITINNTWIGRVGHFWSLAVEEQFYLVWPWLVLFAPRKWLLPAMLLTVPVSIAYRFFAYFQFPFDIGAMDFKAGTFPLASLDSLGLGALLALLWNSSIPKETLQKYLTRAVLPIGAILYLSTLLLYHYRILPSAFFIVGDTFAAMGFIWLISSAGLGFKGIPGKLLEIPVLTYLGKIAYGIYIYHNLTPLILVPVFESLGIPLSVPGRQLFLYSSLLTIAISMVSWHLFELPINNLKRHFPYRSKAPAVRPEPEILVESR